MGAAHRLGQFDTDGIERLGVHLMTNVRSDFIYNCNQFGVNKKLMRHNRYVEYGCICGSDCKFGGTFKEDL